MSALRRPTAVASCVIAFAVLGALAAYLQGTQAAARDDIVHGFARRATLAATLTSGGLNSNLEPTRQYIHATFSGPASEIQAAIERDIRDDPSQPRLLVLDGRGRVLGAYPRTLRRDRTLVQRTAALQASLAGHVAISDLFQAPGGLAFVQSVPYRARSEKRVWAGGFSAAIVTDFARGYLSSALGLPQGRAYLTDGSGTIIAATGREPTGDHLPAALERVTRTRKFAIVKGQVVVSATVPLSAWKVVFVAPSTSLLASIQSTRRAAWRLFAVLAAAVLCMLLLGAIALNRSSRLAHARRHDALTGLANRELFLDTTQRALRAMERRSGHLATLFIDLDRFKPINDLRGHAMGDAVLVAVADRLRSSVRSCDTVGRLGGDEFLVLCPWLQTPDEARRIATRIQDSIAQPLEINGERLSVGCSIGMSIHSMQVDTIDAPTLIANADQAMYQAKNGGRGSIEAFSHA